MRTLFGLHYSPWSVRARWALDHHRLAYAWVEHLPMLGEPLLRLRANKLRGQVTVPLLLDDDGTVVMDSLHIAEYADARASEGSSGTLFPTALRGDIESWNALAEEALLVARKFVVSRTAASDDVLRASLPKPLRNVPGALATARAGAAFFRKKYGLDRVDPSKEPIVTFLDRLRQSIARSPYVLGEFTYADVIAATSLQCLRPAKSERWKITPGLEPAWTDDELSAKYEDLLAWRDGIFAKHW